jgi:hypothetical protein
MYFDERELILYSMILSFKTQGDLSLGAASSGTTVCDRQTQCQVVQMVRIGFLQTAELTMAVCDSRYSHFQLIESVLPLMIYL